MRYFKLQKLEFKQLIDNVGTLPQLIGFIRFGEPVPHGLSARHRVWAGPFQETFYKKNKRKTD